MSSIFSAYPSVKLLINDPPDALHITKQLLLKDLPPAKFTRSDQEHFQEGPQTQVMEGPQTRGEGFNPGVEEVG
ncbi:MAG: hypothetical protein QXP80_04440 [Zestosphaera sp.]